MKKNLKRNIVMAAVLLFVCAAVYLNWSYNNRMGEADSAMVQAEDDAMEAANERYLETAAKEEQESESTPAYFASARLTRQQSRDEALSLLETAAAGEGASQETIDSAMRSITTMATWSMQEAQIESMVVAKGYTDCVAYMSDDSINLAVASPESGLNEADVAVLADIVTSQTDYDLSSIRIIEVG